MRCPAQSKRLHKGADNKSLSESLLAFADSDMPMNISHSLTSDANLLETLMVNNAKVPQILSEQVDSSKS